MVDITSSINRGSVYPENAEPPARINVGAKVKARTAITAHFLPTNLVARPENGKIHKPISSTDRVLERTIPSKIDWIPNILRKKAKTIDQPIENGPIGVQFPSVISKAFNK
jgi:hypothetical protein